MTSPIPDPKARAAILALLKAADGFVSAGMVYTSVKPPAHPGLDEMIAAGNALSSATSDARQFLMCQERHTFGENLGTWRESHCSLEADGHRRHVTAEGRWWEVWSDADHVPLPLTDREIDGITPASGFADCILPDRRGQSASGFVSIDVHCYDRIRDALPRLLAEVRARARK